MLSATKGEKFMKNKIAKKYQSEKGSVTLFVTVAMIFFIIILVGIYLSASGALFKQNSDINEIIKNYEMDMEQIYYEKTKDLVIISLYKPDGSPYSTKEWTNQDITVKVRYPEYTDEEDWLISMDGGEHFANYEENHIVTENTEVVAKVNGEERKVARVVINKIDKIVPTVITNPLSAKFLIGEEETTTNIDLEVITADQGGSGIDEKRLGYAWGSSNKEEPAKYTPVVAEGGKFRVLRENCRRGTYYLWLNVWDNAGNRTDVTCIPVKVTEPIAEMGGVIYESVQEAVNNAPLDGTQATIRVLKNTDEVVVTNSGNNIILELNGKTISNTLVDQATITNNGRLTIIDSDAENIGTISGASKEGILNTETGTVVLGIEDGDMTETEPMIKGKTYGIKNEGTFEFYDGIVFGNKAIIGRVNKTQDPFKTIAVINANIESAYLGLLADPEARIEDIYYSKLTGALSAARQDETVTLVRGLVLEKSLEITDNKNVTLDLYGNVITSNIKDYTFKNYGTFQITDTSEVAAGSITSTVYDTLYNDEEGTLTIKGGTITTGLAGTTSEYRKVITNHGKLILSENGTVKSDKNYVQLVYNNQGNFEQQGGNITATGQYNTGVQNTNEKYIDESVPSIDYMDQVQPNDSTYYFVNNDGKWQNNNQKRTSSIAHSYIKIDLKEKEGVYKLTVNAEISSELYSDYGYATITDTINAPTYDRTQGRFIYISGTVAATDYSIDLEGNNVYYLHLGYIKDYGRDNGTDTFTINKIRLEIYKFGDSTATIKDGNITVSGSNDIGITNNSNFNLEGGNISSYGNAINNNNLGKVAISGGNLTSTNSYVVNNNSTVGVEITGGTIASGSSSSYGVYSTNGTITIGENDGNISTITPDITGKDNGIYLKDGLKLKFYDGIIKGKIGIRGQIGEIATNSEIKRTTVDSIENVTLEENTNPVAKITKDGEITYYYKLQDAIDAYQGSDVQEKELQTWKYEYNGESQVFTVPHDGQYKLRVRGAEGGYRTDKQYGGNGGYASGVVTLKEGEKLYIYVGGSGNTGGPEGGYNGGGSRSTYNGGGGASDIRLAQDDLYSRIIVAGRRRF